SLIVGESGNQLIGVDTAEVLGHERPVTVASLEMLVLQVIVRWTRARAPTADPIIQRIVEVRNGITTTARHGNRAVLLVPGDRGRIKDLIECAALGDQTSLVIVVEALQQAAARGGLINTLQTIAVWVVSVREGGASARSDRGCRVGQAIAHRVIG